MSEAKHTPGPWIVGDITFADVVTHDGTRKGRLAASIHHSGNRFPMIRVGARSDDRSEVAANAYLAAAAPDMRSFLDHDQWKIIGRAIERYSAGEISDLHALGLISAGFLRLDEARAAAIAKAEGRS